jgi:hypothetical protein
MAKAPVDIRSLARSHGALAIQTLAGIARSGTNEAARVSAANSLLDRGWGRAHIGEQGETELVVTIRDIRAEMAERRAGMTIEHESDKPPLLPAGRPKVR